MYQKCIIIYIRKVDFNENEIKNFVIYLERMMILKYHGNILKFLRFMKRNIENGRWKIVPRRKNKQAILIMPISLIKLILLNLRVNNWYKGPEHDNNPKYAGYVWMFHKQIGSKRLYIKIKLIHNTIYTKILSFHFDR